MKLLITALVTLVAGLILVLFDGFGYNAPLSFIVTIIVVGVALALVGLRIVKYEDAS